MYNVHVNVLLCDVRMCRQLSWILVKNAGDSTLAQLKDKNGYTAADHAGMGKTPRYVVIVMCMHVQCTCTLYYIYMYVFHIYMYMDKYTSATCTCTCMCSTYMYM